MSIYPRDNRDLRQEYKIIDRTVRASSVTEEGCFRKSTARRQRRKISIVMATDVRNIAPLVADSRQEKSRRHLSDHCDMCPEVSIRLLGIVVVLAAMDDPVAGGGSISLWPAEVVLRTLGLHDQRTRGINLSFGRMSLL